MGPRNRPRRLKSIHLGHGEVENNYIRAKLFSFADCVFSVLGVSADTPVLMIFYQAAQQAADCGVIVGDQNAYCHRGVRYAAFLIACRRTPRKLLFDYPLSTGLKRNTLNTGLPGALPAPKWAQVGSRAADQSAH